MQTPAFSNTFSRPQGGALLRTRPSHRVPRAPARSGDRTEPSPHLPQLLRTAGTARSWAPDSLAPRLARVGWDGARLAGRWAGLGPVWAGLGPVWAGLGQTGAAVVRAPPLYSGDAGGRSPSGSARRRGGDATAAVIVRLGLGRALSFSSPRVSVCPASSQLLTLGC